MVWEERYTLQYWNWLYRENPARCSLIRVAESEHKIIAHVAGIPLMMKTDKEFAGYLGIQGATHPDYRGRGIMKALGNELVQEAEMRGLGLGLGIARVGRQMERVGMHILGSRVRATRMKDFFLVLNLERMFRRTDADVKSKAGALFLRLTHKLRKVEPPGQIEIKQMSGFDQSFDKLWSTASSSLSLFAIKRSADYLRWRYALHPESEYLTWVAKENDALLGYVVAKHERSKDSHTGLIADIFGLVQRRDALEALVSNVASYLNKRMLKC